MVKDWKCLLSKAALCVGMLCSVGASLVSVTAVKAAPPEPQVLTQPATLPFDAMAQTCIDAATAYAACLSRSAYPPIGSGICETFRHEAVACREKYVLQWNIYNEQARTYSYYRQKQINEKWYNKILVAVGGGVLDFLGMIAQKVAYETAQLILTGGDSQEPMFWNQPFGKWLENTANQAGSEFLYNLDKFVQQQTAGTPLEGLSLCRRPNPSRLLTIKMSLGMGRLAMLNPRGQCTLSNLADNFEAIADMVESGDALAIQRPQFYEGGPANDLSAGLQINSSYLNYRTGRVSGAELARKESAGMKPIADKITGALQYPSVLANNSMMQLDPVMMAQKQQDKQESYMMQTFWQAGVEALGWISLKVFLNTMALGILHKIFDPKKPSGVGVAPSPGQAEVQFEVMKNADAAGDAQNLFERQDFAKSLGDFVIPNFGVTEEQDLVSALSECSEPRTRWNCAMDEGLVTALSLNEEGAMTVGKASGIGSESAKISPAAKGLHPEWELIPENDIKNNTDPSCYTRAYCAGNLKKMRLARILPVGWEMAANSPYNVKKDGKYVTLGDVIRGFYNCNDQGQLDKDHPWCHLIDPNWILTAPKFQCRSRGYGDAISSELGTRMEECGDMVSCLSTNQKGECTGGFGYCLAERPVYRFTARECESQYASCRTWTKSNGDQLSALRYTAERGNCADENVGCQWFATQRYVTSTKSPDGLWVGTVTSGPRVYWDKNIQTCSSEGCTKMLKFNPGQTALNLVQNGSFELIDTEEANGVTNNVGLTGWTSQVNCGLQYNYDKHVTSTSVDGLQSFVASQTGCPGNPPEIYGQRIEVGGGRNYTLTLDAKSKSDINVPVKLQFFKKDPANPAGVLLTHADHTITSYEGCLNGWDKNDDSLKFTIKITPEFSPFICQFVTPPDAEFVMLDLGGATNNPVVYDTVQLEEGEYSTQFVDGTAQDLESTYLKIAPDEYKCTGNDATDNPACKRFARVCRQLDVGCQGYKDVEDSSAPEIPATLSEKDLCPAICAGYGKYEKMASSFDLVRNADPRLDDPEDQSTEYFIPDLAQSCYMEDVGCEAFTSMESATGTGEQVSYFNDLRYCQKPNDKSTTYYTWEGSDITGYQLVTWALIREDVGNGPKVVLTGGKLGIIKDPATCDEALWKSGADQDCRQFYDERGTAYYRYYSQTVTSDVSCTRFRKDDSSQADCAKTGGTEFVPQTKSCMYDAMPGLSASCKAEAGGCRAYMGPTGRNAANVMNEAFTASSSIGWFSPVTAGTMKFSLSKESVIVGDKSMKLEPTPATGPINAYMALALPSTSTLYRVSFWAKAASNTTATVVVDGQTLGQFSLSPLWKRYEFGPFYAKGAATQGTQQVQKSCGNFTVTPDAGYVAKVKAANATLSDADAAALAATQATSLWNNGFITNNLAAVPATCTDNTVCQNRPVYDSDGTTVVGTANGKCGFTGAVASVQWTAPANSKAIYLDTLRVDQLNDIQFVRKGLWSVPVACDSTYPEGEPQARAMVGCRAYNDRDSNTVYVRNFGNLCNTDAIGCKAFVDTHDRPSAYPQTITVKGTKGPSTRQDGIARAYEEQYLGDWNVVSQAYRYYYAIDDDRGRCDSGQAMCRAFGQPAFAQDRLGLATTTNAVNPKDADVYANQKTVNQFKTVLMKDDWGAYMDDNGNPKLACRKDELFCDRFQSGNVTEYFRDPGNHMCEWQTGKDLKRNDAMGIPSDGTYNGWFRKGTDIPCYPGFQKNGDTYGAYYTGEDQYAGWVGACPADQSECTELVDPNDLSDPAMPTGRSYFMIYSNQIDTQTCGGSVDPLSGCVLFNNKNVSTLEASSKATYSKVVAQKGAAQSPINCDTDKENPYCMGSGKCVNFVKKYRPQKPGESDIIYKTLVIGHFDVLWEKQLADSGLEGSSCASDDNCAMIVMDGINPDASPGQMVGTCYKERFSNDANLIVKVKLERECARWMGCRTGETVFDSAQQKYVTQCSQMQLCQKNGSKNEDIYCAQFTDRDKENFLFPGQFVNAKSYSRRSVGFGAMDYSGLIAPDAYLVADVEAHNVGADLLKNAYNGVYKQDKRLVARVPVKSPLVTQENDPTFDAVKLCKDWRTNRWGYLTGDWKFCYLPISEAASLAASAGGAGGGDTSRDIQRLYKEFQNQNVSRRNSTMQSAMPEPECQLYPEQDSPVPNEFVTEWNTKVEPPVPTAMAPGYENAKACVYGEDCSCSYRKARYDASEPRYYSAFGKAPSVGVCVGGEIEGSPCVPGGYIPVDSKNKVLVQAQGTTDPTAGCKGGICMALQDVVVQNGRYGYCLERDKTRISEISQTIAPCLSWSPLNVLGGKYDTTHYSPTAGYLPPQGSGEFYCVTGANSQRLFTPTPATENNSGQNYLGKFFVSPGYLRHFEFDRTFVGFSQRAPSDILNSSAYSSEGDKIVGAKTQSMMFACRRTSICEGVSAKLFDSGGPLDANLYSQTEARWIQTGSTFGQSYMEYFIPYIRQDEKGNPGLGYKLDEDSYDFKFGLFKFSIKPYAAGSACKWNVAWLGMSLPTVQDKKKTVKDANGNDQETDKQDLGSTCQAYLSSINSLSEGFYTGFKNSFPGVLDRSSENLLTDSQNKPIRLGCVDNPEEKPQVGSGQNCYFKYWQTGFQYNSQEAFVWADRYKQANPDSQTNFNFWKQVKGRNSLAKQCQSDKPYFAIRAMFQNMNRAENNLSEEDAVTRQLKGPWQFVGFWFTTCLPQNGLATDPGLLYMQLDIVTADVCRQVGQVVSPYTRESAAFADRVWSNGNFALPILGMDYGVRNQPFGSAIAAGSIGHDPMVLGASVPLSTQKGGTGFVDSGQGIQPLLMTQQNTWAPLTNLFAKVYKIYRWESSLVNKLDWVCVGGDNQGKNCTPPDGKQYTNHYQAIKTCTGYAKCDPNLDVDVKNQNWRCNTLSGVNRGLRCGEMEQPRNLDAICHNGPVAYPFDTEDQQTDPKLKTHIPLPLYGRCSPEMQLDYYLTPSDLSGLGVCKTTYANSHACYLTLFSANNSAANIGLTGSCVSESNQGSDYQDLCSPLIEQIRTDLSTGGHNPGPNASQHLSDCVYTTEDDWQDNGPRIYFKYTACKNNPNTLFIQPKRDGLNFDLDSNGYIRQDQTVLALVYMALKWGSVQAGGQDGSGGICNTASEGGKDFSFTDFIRNFEPMSDKASWINAYLVSDFPELANKNVKISSQVIKGVRRYWGQYGGFKGNGTPYSLANNNECIILPEGNVKIPNAVKSPIKGTFNFGPFNRGLVEQSAIFRCQDTQGKPVVNPGARCGGESDESVDCPIKIEACTGGITPGDKYDNPAFNRQVAKPNMQTGQSVWYSVPSCGFCTIGGTGRETYQELDPYRFQEGFKDTGYCFGFNPLSRCKTDSDCRFTEYEYWGAFDKGKGVGTRFGSAEPNFIVSNLDLFNGAKPAFSEVKLKDRNLPTPLFDDGNGGAMTEVPEEYSKASVLSVAGHDAGFVDVNYRGGDGVTKGGDTSAYDKVWHFNEAQKFGVLKQCDASDCGDGTEFECKECGFGEPKHDDDNNGILQTLDSPKDYPPVYPSTVGEYLCPIKPYYRICRTLAQHGYNADYLVKDDDGDNEDPNDDNDMAYAIKKAHLIALMYCLQTCNSVAYQFPNTYAYNFDKIVGENRIKNKENLTNNSNDSTKGKKMMRMAAVAPFAINPLMRTLQSLGARIWFWNKSGDGDVGYADSYIQWAKGKLLQWSGAVSYKVGVQWSMGETLDLTGEMFTRMPFSHAFAISGYDGWTVYQQANKYLYLLQDLSKGYVNMEGMLYGTPFYYNGQVKGNEAFPWAPTLYSQAIFPLALGGDYPPLGQLSSGGYQYLKGQYWPWGFVQYSNYWKGYGVPEALYAATDEFLKAIQAKNYATFEDFKAFYKAYRFGMRDEFFDKTGWGVFLDPKDERLKLYPGAMQVASPNQDTNRSQNVGTRPYEVFVPGHCEPPVGGTDSDTVTGKLANVRMYDEKWAFSSSPTVKDEQVYRFMSPWVPLDELWDKWNTAHDEYYGEKGLISPDNYEWIPAYIASDGTGGSMELPGPSDPNMKVSRSPCRCVGGSLDGQIVEGEGQCNPRMQPSDNPDNFDEGDTRPDWQYCKPATYPGDDYKNAMSYYVGKNVVDKSNKALTVKGKDAQGNKIDMPMSYGVTQIYINELDKLKPGVDAIPECYQAYGNAETIDPDQDNNACTHSPGYMSRNDVCKDGRDHCLVSYDLTNPVSVNNISVLSEQSPQPAWAPTATDVSGGLDAFGYISSGNTNLSNGEYISWYRPRPPMVAAPDMTKSAASANAQPAIYMDAFNLNSRPEGLSYFGGGQGLATIQFYAWAAHDQGPIRKIVIDWGDGQVQTIDSAQLKNQKPFCNTDRECEFVPGLACSADADCPAGTGACVPTGSCTKNTFKQCSKDEDCGGEDTCQKRLLFGNSNDACRQGYLEFQHIYTCSMEQVVDLAKTKTCDAAKVCENAPDLTCSSCRVGEKCVDGLAPSGGCYNSVLNRCRYTPKIQVFDSWGWCTGNCSQPKEMSPNGLAGSYLIRHPFGGCYDGSNTKINVDVVDDPDNSKPLPNECAQDSIMTNKTYRPWVVYKGSVEVAPLMPGPGTEQAGGLYGPFGSIIKTAPLLKKIQLNP